MDFIHEYYRKNSWAVNVFGDRSRATGESAREAGFSCTRKYSFASILIHAQPRIITWLNLDDLKTQFTRR